MKIRSITFFLACNWPGEDKSLGKAGQFLENARQAGCDAGYDVQTKRLATTSFQDFLGDGRIKDLPELAVQYSTAGKAVGIDYISLGPARLGHPAGYEAIPEAIAASQDTFFSGILAEPGAGISMPAVRACAQVIHLCSHLSPDGFANLRFAALANVRPGSPFFPAAYHDDSEPGFAFATEAADLAVDAFSQARSIPEGQAGLRAAIQEHTSRLTTLGMELSKRYAVKFKGIDFSLAPHPNEAISLGAAMERMGVPAVGWHGSLAASAIMAEAVDRVDFQRTGFSGLMLPVLEDSGLAKSAASGVLTVKDLLLYSAVCGTGLDTVPLPGDSSLEQLAAVLLDVAALALRLDKPLTARLMPIPGKKAGEPTDFSFGFFTNSRIMSLQAEELGGAFKHTDGFQLAARKK